MRLRRRYLVAFAMLLALSVANTSASRTLPQPHHQGVPSPAQGLDWDDWQMEVWPFWERGITGDGVRVAVLDTGVDGDHPFFEGRVRTDLAWDADQVNRDCQGVTLDGTPIEPNDLTDCFGHGTHVAGVVAANGSTVWGPIRGIAYQAEILPVKVAALRGDYVRFFGQIDPGQIIYINFPVPEPMSFLDVELSWDDPSNDLSVTLTSPTHRSRAGQPYGDTSEIIRHFPVRREFDDWQVEIAASASNPGVENFVLRIYVFQWVPNPDFVDEAIDYAVSQGADVINLSFVN